MTLPRQSVDASAVPRILAPGEPIPLDATTATIYIGEKVTLATPTEGERDDRPPSELGNHHE